MENRPHGTSNGCIFQWKIENISHYWLKNVESIESPRFVSDALKGTKWFLMLCPSWNFIQLFLYREKDCSGPESVTVGFEISLLGKDGIVLQQRISTNSRWPKNWSDGWMGYEERNKVFVTHRDAFLPNDTLTVQCKVWDTDQKIAQAERIFARTTFSVNRGSFRCEIEEVSIFKWVKIHSFKDSLIDFDIVLKEGPEPGKVLVLNINSFDKSITYFSFKAFTIDSGGEKESCCTQEYFEGDLKNGVLFTLIFAKNLLEKSQYLDYEYVYSNGSVSGEYSVCGTTSSELTNEMQKVDSRNKHHVEEEKFETMTVMAKDLISMYNDRIFSDIEIRTSTKHFPAHKNILCARSPVFKKMLSYDMKEQISGRIDIDDLEDDTVHRMLLYMYTDTLDDLQYESAYKLYEAADKYEILSLRDICSSFMQNSLCPNNACDVLVLADRHKDDGLKSNVCDFILKCAKEVFGSQEWENFMKANKNLALDITYRYALSKI